MSRPIAIALLTVVGAALVGAALVVGLALSDNTAAEYPAPAEAVQRYVESASDLGQATGFDLKGTLPTWNGFIVLYTSAGAPDTELLNYRLAKYGTSGWRADTGVGFAISSPANPNDVIEWHVDSRIDHSSDLNGPVETAVAFGRVAFGGITVVEVTFDRGQTHQTVPSGGFFAVAAVGATDVRIIKALAADGSEVIVIDRTDPR